MTVQARLIDGVLSRFNGNQRQAAKAVGISIQGFNNYVRGTRTAEDEAIAAMADFLGENAAKAVAEHHIETAKSDRVRQVFSALAKVACTVLLLVPVAHQALAAQVPFFVRVSGLMHIMSAHIVQRIIGFAQVSLVKLYRQCHVADTAPRLLA